jgi:hypothetical protein
MKTYKITKIWRVCANTAEEAEAKCKITDIVFNSVRQTFDDHNRETPSEFAKTVDACINPPAPVERKMFSFKRKELQ